jgi:hypothetical protein
MGLSTMHEFLATFRRSRPASDGPPDTHVLFGPVPGCSVPDLILRILKKKVLKRRQ